VARVLATLRADDREVIVLRYLLGLDEAEMAATLGCARGTVKSRLSRALGRMREALGSEGTWTR
jgi:RNA polymerase sigma-70 factor (ECF subfamily)